MTVKVLLVEDEALIAFGIAADLEGTEFDIVAHASTVEQALNAACRQDIDLVLLDGNLRGESSQPIAEQLAKADTPYIILTGYTSTQLGEWIGDAPRLNKPYGVPELLALMRRTV